MKTLGADPRVLRLARDLGLSVRGDPVAELKRHALEKVEGFIEDFEVGDLEMLRDVVANRLSVSIEFVRADEDLPSIGHDFSGYYRSLDRLLDDEFGHKDTEGLLLCHPSPAPGEHRYLAVIDARGDRAWRAYFTAWHELAHLLVDPPQQSFKYRTTPKQVDIKKDPVESVVDVIAGMLAYYEPIFLPALRAAMAPEGRISFQAIETARAAVAPEASFLSAVFAALSHIEEPVTFLTVEPGYKKSEVRKLKGRQQGLFPLSPEEAPQIKLRAQNVVVRGQNPLKIYKNMRVPTSSVLSRAYESASDGQILEAVEDQCQWETSATGPLPAHPIRVSAMRIGTYVYGLVFPLA